MASSAPTTTNIPPYGPMIDSKSLAPAPVWYSFFLSLANTLTGGTSGIIISGTNFAPTSANTVLAGAPSGGATKPAFRVLESSDLNNIAGAFPGVTNAGPAPAGDVGEFVSSSVTSAVSLTSATAADIASITLGAGDWDVWASFGTQASGASQTLISSWINSVSVTDPGSPNGGAYLSRGIAAGESTNQFAPVGMMQLSLAAGTQMFLSAKVAFTGGTVGGIGFIGARRRR